MKFNDRNCFSICRYQLQSVRYEDRSSMFAVFGIAMCLGVGPRRLDLCPAFSPTFTDIGPLAMSAALGHWTIGDFLSSAGCHCWAYLSTV